MASDDKTLLYVGLAAAAYFLFFSGSGSAALSGGGISGGLGGGDGGLLSGGGGQGFQGSGTSGTASTTAGSTTGSNPLPNADGTTTRDHRKRNADGSITVNPTKSPTPDPNNSNGFFRDATGQKSINPRGPAPRAPLPLDSNGQRVSVMVNPDGSYTPLTRTVDASGHGTVHVPAGQSGGNYIIASHRKAPPAVGAVSSRITQTTSGKFTGATQANGNYVAAKPNTGNSGKGPPKSVNRTHAFNSRGGM